MVAAKYLNRVADYIESIISCSLLEKSVLVVNRSNCGTNMHISLMKLLLANVEETPAGEADVMIAEPLTIHIL